MKQTTQKMTDIVDKYAKAGIMEYMGLRRNFAAIDFDAMNEDIAQLGVWPVPPQDMDPNLILDDFYTVLQPLIDKHAPLQSMKVRRDTPPLYLQPETRRVMKLRDEARARGRKEQYRTLRNKAVRLVRGDRMKTTNERLRTARNPLAESWRLAGSIIGPTSPELPSLQGTSSNQESATKVNKFYIDKIRDLRSSFPQNAKPLTSAKTESVRSTFALHCVGVRAVKRAIFSLKNTKATGVDGIPVSFWKGCARNLVMPITYLVNASIRMGIVPDTFKKAIVHPIFKGGNKDPESPSSYRPVAVLPALSKVLEKIVCEQLTNYLEENELLPREQHGFRRGRSIGTAMASAVHAWATRTKTKSRDPDLLIAAYDFSAAFDTVDMEELDIKLDRIGAMNETRRWFRSYMTDGLQRVSWNGELSDFLRVEVGVRQGSLLGPLIFLVITMDIPATLGNAIAYADDNSAWSCGHDVETLHMEIELASARLVDISTSLKLSLNPQKTQLMWVGGSAASGDLPVVSVANVEVKPSDSIEILGLKLDKKLSPAPFVVTLRSSLARALGVLRRLKPSVPPHLLVSFAQGMFFSRLRVYAGLVFDVRLNDSDPHSKGADQTQVLINDVARVVTGNRRADRVRVRDLLDQANLPSLNAVVVLTAGMLAWHMAKPTHSMHHIYADSSMDSATRAAAAGLLRVTDCVESIGVRNAQRVWNGCPDLRKATTEGSARSALKKLVRQLPL